MQAIAGGGGAGAVNDQEMSRIRANYEWQVQRSDEELRTLQSRLMRLESRRQEFLDKWEKERQGLQHEISRYAAVLTRYAIPLDEACEGATADAPWGATCAAPAVPVGNAAGAPCGGAAVAGGECGGAGMGADEGHGRGRGGSQEAEGPGPGAQDGNGGRGSRRSNFQESSQQAPAANRSERGSGAAATAGASNAASGGDAEAASALPPAYIASTLQAMFPHATVRTQTEDSGNAGGGDDDQGLSLEETVIDLPAGEAERLAAELQVSTRSRIDERALRALNGLRESETVEVLRRVTDLVSAQGGRCRNLSSILQSVCRKLERRAAGRSGQSEEQRRADLDSDRDEDGHGDDAGRGGDSADDAGEQGDGTGRSRKSRTRSRRKRSDGGDDEGGPSSPEREEAGGASDSGSGGSDGGEGRPRRESRRGPRREARRERKRRAKNKEGDRADDMAGSDDGEDDDEDEDAGQNDASRRDREEDEDARGGAAAAAPSPEYWTYRRVERTAARGFEVRRRGDRWELKLVMGALDPPLTQAGMDLYCKWLRTRLAAFRDEHGYQALRKCCGELDFSNNGLRDESVWMLLEVLAQFEVHAASLKLFKNRISQAGVLAICEFIRTNRRAGAVHEMHLSHNEIDDEAALELLRTLQEQRGRYPPRRAAEGAEGGTALVPVWVRLNHNRIRDPLCILRTLEAEGITYCSARNANGCGPGKCARFETPLTHLYLFADQAIGPSVNDEPVGAAEADANATSRRKRGRRARHRDAQAAHAARDAEEYERNGGGAGGGAGGGGGGGGGWNAQEAAQQSYPGNIILQ
eukprot:TRINITY_DN19983_c0_g4_i1.p1 TRINITY_DN19983_c0_g4~~TRINITY_DN19983_c0_g4_i1.p1  ORF type:complete len:834 (-),score=195.71 TRINITY_DN19983_c0_g4_i1:163-2595(-)